MFDGLLTLQEQDGIEAAVLWHIRFVTGCGNDLGGLTVLAASDAPTEDAIILGAPLPPSEPDCTGDGIPDECEPNDDCNATLTLDDRDLVGGDPRFSDRQGEGRSGTRHVYVTPSFLGVSVILFWTLRRVQGV